VSHRRCPQCGKFVWVVRGWSSARSSWIRWRCGRCDAPLQANPVRMRISRRIDNVCFCFWLILPWFIGLSKDQWTDSVMFFTAFSIAMTLVEFAGRGIQLAQDDEEHVDPVPRALADDRHGGGRIKSGPLKCHRCPNCGRFEWRRWRWTWALGIRTRWNCPECGVLLEADPVQAQISVWVAVAVCNLGLLTSLLLDASFWYTPSFWSAVVVFAMVVVLTRFAISGVHIAQDGRDGVAYALGDAVADVQPPRCPDCGRLAERRWAWSWERGIWTRWSCPHCGVLVPTQ